MSLESKITIATDIDDEEHETVKSEHFEVVNNNLKTVNEKFKEISYQLQQSIRRASSHFKNSKSHNYKVKLFYLIETIAFIAIFVLQYFYIRQLANK